MKKYAVYALVNSSLQEVYFGMSADVTESVDELPPEILHWEFGVHAISNAVLIEEELSLERAGEVIREVEEKSLKNPQGKKILINRAVQREEK